MKYQLLAFASVALLLCSASAVMAEDVKVEQTTESPIADMALVDTQPALANMEQEENKQEDAKVDSAQPHTIADFIIHPLIALKPRVQEEPVGEGKQAETSTTPSPWQLFGFNAGQGLGSSVSSLAGSVTGWLGNRIQLPGLVDTPVRESTTTSTSTTTTTTPRPDIVVRVQHRTTRRPLIRIGDRPNRFNNNFNDYEEYPEDDEYFDSGENRDEDDNDDDAEEEDNDNENDDVPREEEEDEEEDEEEERPIRKNKPNQRRRRPAQGNNKRRINNNNVDRNRRFQSGPIHRNQKRRRPQDSNEAEDNAVEESEENVDDANDEVEDDGDQDFFYNDNGGSTKRSQNQQNFIQRGQQSLINQIRQLTRSQAPVEVSSSNQQVLPASTVKSRRHQGTLVIKRNGQTVYLAPEQTQSQNSANQIPFLSSGTSSNQKRPVGGFPQPPLTVPYKRKGKPTQYITIPWSQLGIAPPGQLVSVSEGIQSQPLILNIPQSALEAMQNSKPGKRKTILTSEAVPILAEASLMDVFKPPQIPHNRSPSPPKPIKKATAAMTPILITTKTKQRVRPGTIVEMAPAVESISEPTESSTGNASSASSESEGGHYILVGEDGESGVARHAFPVLGETRHYASFTPYFNLLQSRPYPIRNGRQLSQAGAESVVVANSGIESEMKSEKELLMEMPAESPKVAADVQGVALAKEMATVEQPAELAEETSAKQIKSVVMPMTEASAEPSAEEVMQHIPVHVVTSSKSE